MQISDLSTPAALIERSTMEANAKAMAQRAHRLAVRLRPHVKTHKCVEIARLQVEDHFGGITVSTFAEAEFLEQRAFVTSHWRFHCARSASGRLIFPNEWMPFICSSTQSWRYHRWFPWPGIGKSGQVYFSRWIVDTGVPV